MGNLVKCKACGKEIAKGVKKCPDCGKDQRSFFAKHKIITGIGVLVIIGMIGSLLGDEDTDATKTNTTTTSSTSTDNQETNTETVKVTEAPEPTATPEPMVAPMVVTSDELFDALTNNALKASNTYKGQIVELTGKLSNIDSSGDYFSLGSLTDEFSFDTVLCNIKKEHLDTVMNFENGQEVTIVGVVTDIGEVLGYTVDVEKIK